MTRFTKEGYEKLQKDYEDLKKERVGAVVDLQKARAMGDLSENGYYKAARAKLSTIDRNLRYFSSLLTKGEIIEKNANDSVGIGSIVTLSSKEGEITYNIVGDIEASPLEKKISLLSPLGRVLAHKKGGDTIIFDAPQGKKRYTLIRLR